MLKPPQLLPTPDLEEFQEKTINMCKDRAKHSFNLKTFAHCVKIKLYIQSRLTTVEHILSPL